MPNDRERVIALNLIPDIGPARVRRLREVFGTLEGIWRASARELQQVEGISPILAERIVTGCRDTRLLFHELALAQRGGVSVVTQLDEEYPPQLKTIHDPPLVLYRRGAWTEQDAIAVAIVGSRRASWYGRQVAERLAHDLAIRGVTVVSGLARGIDAAAHRGALKAGGRTLAVLGCGLSHIYPPEHEELAGQVVEHGAVISEYPMGMEPLPHHFPRRNRVISGLSLGVVVVEATQRSGALITADCALEQGREVFAVPGNIDSVASHGTHQLLKQGAKLVTSVDDILEELRLRPIPVPTPSPAIEEQASAGPAEAVTDPERGLMAHVAADEPVDVDELSAKTGLSVSACAATLLQLELKHMVKQLPGKRFVASDSAVAQWRSGEVAK